MVYFYYRNSLALTWKDKNDQCESLNEKERNKKKCMLILHFGYVPDRIINIYQLVSINTKGIRGAMVARLTPDQKVACSIHVGFKSLMVPTFFKNKKNFGPKAQSIIPRHSTKLKSNSSHLNKVDNFLGPKPNH